MKPIVFLDFDGVIMTQATYSRPWTEPGPVPSHAYRLMDPALVANVDALCEAIGAEVVLSTAWRPYDGNRGEIRRALRARGLRAKVVGQTPRLYLAPMRMGSRELPRGWEIRCWLDEHRPGWTPEDVWILDDDPEVVLTEPVEEDGVTCYAESAWARARWVQSDFVDGFDAERLAVALALPRRAP